MRYRVVPQGALSTGDCYTYWYDFVIRSILRVKKCVNDVLGWAETLEQLFFDTAFFLFHTNSFGIIQNLAKFTWGRRELEFLGFWMKEDGIKPTQDTIDAIDKFPRPSDITGVRSFYGLEEQVAFTFAKTELMQPFRKLLVKNAAYSWDQSMQDAFVRAKSEISKLVSKGVSSFKVNQ